MGGEVALGPGWNNVAVPLLGPGGAIPAEALVEQMQQQGISVLHLARWHNGA